MEHMSTCRGRRPWRSATEKACLCAKSNCRVMSTETLLSALVPQIQCRGTRPSSSFACAPFSYTSSTFRSTSSECSESFSRAHRWCTASIPCSSCACSCGSHVTTHVTAVSVPRAAAAVGPYRTWRSSSMGAGCQYRTWRRQRMPVPQAGAPAARYRGYPLRGPLGAIGAIGALDATEPLEAL
eukprot:2146679-Rhodomonas_salina.1